jgi:hypothetical protein
MPYDQPQSKEDIQAAKQEFPKPGKLSCVTNFMLQDGSLEIPFVMQAFVL